MAERYNVRVYHRTLRDGMTEEEVSRRSEAICGHILSSEPYQRADVLYAYYPIGNEVNILPVVRQAFADKKIVVLPRTGTACHMEFYRIEDLTRVKEGRFRVPEPVAACPLFVGDRGVILVPGVVFDRSGNRHGYGKGYYDRYLSRFPGLYRMAAAYENQMEERLNTLPTDERMDAVCTETGVVQFAPHR